VGGSTVSKSPIRSGLQDVGHEGVGTGRAVLSLCSSCISGGSMKTPTD